jgi:hypothetical protein
MSYHGPISFIGKPPRPEALVRRMVRLYAHQDSLDAKGATVAETIEQCLCNLVEVEWGPDVLYAAQVALHRQRFGLGRSMSDLRDEELEAASRASSRQGDAPELRNGSGD